MKNNRNRKRIKRKGVIKNKKIVPSSTSQPIPGTSSTSTKETVKCIFKPEDLRRCFLPMLQKLKLFQSAALSMAFQQSPDPTQLDHSYTIKHPVDLSSIESKLDHGLYVDPWNFVDDIWLIFDNAHPCNDEASKVDGCCKKLVEIFETEIDQAMQVLGYCCGRRYTFSPKMQICYGKLCNIPIDAECYTFRDKYKFCVKCFHDSPGDTIIINEAASKCRVFIKKDRYVLAKNDHIEMEPFVDCLDCGRKFHQICVLHMDEIWPEGFVCDNCLRKKNANRDENRYTVRKFPSTELSTLIENRVNNSLKRRGSEAGEVTVRVISTFKSSTIVKPGLKSLFVDKEKLAPEFPYNARTILAFQKIDGIDVCIFGMKVQEYGSECPQPNTRRVYITHLDSVQVFQPKHHRTMVYREIVLGYLNYIKQLGYIMAHVWIFAPPKGVELMFYRHPKTQKMPERTRLLNWFLKMFDEGILDRIVLDYKDVIRQAIENNVQSPFELPYFDDDFWPGALEETIRQLDEEEKMRQANNIECNISREKLFITRVNDAVISHMKSSMVIRLNSTEAADDLPPIQDYHPYIFGEELSLLVFCRVKNYEFSSLRRAKFSSMALLYQLHILEKIMYLCTTCKDKVEARYHCTQCVNFNLCKACYTKVNHCHKMEKLGFDLDDCNRTPIDPRESRKISDETVIRRMMHICQCRNSYCKLRICLGMKQMIQHSKICEQKMKGACGPCKKIYALIRLYHVKHCNDTNCAFRVLRFSYTFGIPSPCILKGVSVGGPTPEDDITFKIPSPGTSKSASVGSPTPEGDVSIEIPSPGTSMGVSVGGPTPEDDITFKIPSPGTSKSASVGSPTPEGDIIIVIPSPGTSMGASVGSTTSEDDIFSKFQSPSTSVETSVGGSSSEDDITYEIPLTDTSMGASVGSPTSEGVITSGNPSTGNSEQNLSLSRPSSPYCLSERHFSQTPDVIENQKREVLRTLLELLGFPSSNRYLEEQIFATMKTHPQLIDEFIWALQRQLEQHRLVENIRLCHQRLFDANIEDGPAEGRFTSKISAPDVLVQNSSSSYWLPQKPFPNKPGEVINRRREMLRNLIPQLGLPATDHQLDDILNFIQSFPQMMNSIVSMRQRQLQQPRVDYVLSIQQQAIEEGVITPTSRRATTTSEIPSPDASVPNSSFFKPCPQIPGMVIVNYDRDDLRHLLPPTLELVTTVEELDEFVVKLNKHVMEMAAFVSQQQEELRQIVGERMKIFATHQERLPVDASTPKSGKNRQRVNASNVRTNLRKSILKQGPTKSYIIKSIFQPFAEIRTYGLQNDVPSKLGDETTTSDESDNWSVADTDQNVSKEWHTQIDANRRELLVEKSLHKIQSIISSEGDGAGLPCVVQNMDELKSAVETEERHIYEAADSKSEYYDLLSDMCQKIGKEFVERKR